MFVIIVNCVASEPVPLVVGIATIGGVGTVITLPRKSLIEPPLVATAPIAFMVSIGEPPPTAIRKSHFSSFQAFKPVSTILSVGSPVTPSKIAYCVLLLSSISVTLLAFPSFTIIGSVTIRAFLPKAEICSEASDNAFSP